MDTITVNSRYKRYSIKPNKISFDWNYYQKTPMDPIAKTIEKLPHITNKSLNPMHPDLTTIGDKKLAVFLDGRRLSEAEILSLPSILVAQASLVTFPNVTDAGENTAIIYLTSASNLYSYHFEEIRGALDLGTTGPSITYRHSGKKGSWSNNLLLNAYSYRYKNSYTNHNYHDTLYQKDVLSDKSKALLFSGTMTKVGEKGSLLTIGLFGNLSNAGNNGTSNNYTQQTDNMFYSSTKSINMNGGIFSNWRYTNKKGSTWKLNSNFNYRPLSTFTYDQKVTDSNAGDIHFLHSESKPRGFDMGLGGSFSFKKKSLNKFSYTSGYTLSYRYRYDELYNSIMYNGNVEMQDKQFTQSDFYAGYWGKLESKSLSLNLSVIGNYSFPNGYYMPFFQKSYIYPRLVLGYSISKKKSLTLSFSIPTYRPSFSSMIADSSYRNNWLKKEGNRFLKAERDFNTEVMYSLETGAFSIEALLSISYASNAIVDGLVKDTLVSGFSFLSTYFNTDYWEKKFSFNVDYSPVKNLKASLNTEVGYGIFKWPVLKTGFQRGYFYNSNIKVSYSRAKYGDISLFANWDARELSFMEKSRQWAYVDLFYSTTLSKSLNCDVGIYDIFNSKGNQLNIFNEGLVTDISQKRRTISISLVWRLGQLFAMRSATSDSSSKAPDDIKK